MQKKICQYVITGFYRYDGGVKFIIIFRNKIISTVIKIKYSKYELIFQQE